jgi:hypothetical protein
VTNPAAQIAFTVAHTHIFHALAPMHKVAETIFKTHLYTIAETIMLTTMNSINKQGINFHQFSLQNRTQMLLITLHKHTVAAHGISITCSFLITMQHPSTHSRKRKQTNVHTIAAHGISMNTASPTRLHLPSPHGRKENTPTFHTVAAHGLLQLQLDTQGNNSHQLMA